MNNDIQQIYFSGKKKKHCIKYEIGVDINNGTLCWLWGGIPGSMHDLTMARMSGIINALENNEFILADKGYIGEHIFVTPFRDPQNDVEEAFNSALGSHRIIVENVLLRVKIFNSMSYKWRHELYLHPIVFTVICNIVNIDMLFCPVRQ